MKNNALAHVPKSPTKALRRIRSSTALMLACLLCLLVAGSAQAQECPELLSFSTDGISGLEIAIYEHYAFVVGSGLHVFDVSDPMSPIEVWYQFQYSMAECSVSPSTNGVAIKGHFAYITYFCTAYMRQPYYTGIVVLDISDPTHPLEVGAYNTFVYLATLRSIKISGEYAYVATAIGGLTIFNIHDPIHPVLTGNLDTPGYAINIEVFGELAFIVDRDMRLSQNLFLRSLRALKKEMCWGFLL